MTLGRIAAATLSRIDTPPYSPDKSNVETSAPLSLLSLYFYPANFPLRSKRVGGRYPVEGEGYRQRGVLHATHSANSR